jgi:hypothetical protein
VVSEGSGQEYDVVHRWARALARDSLQGAQKTIAVVVQGRMSGCEAAGTRMAVRPRGQLGLRSWACGATRSTATLSVQAGGRSLALGGNKEAPLTRLEGFEKGKEKGFS